TQSAEPGRDRLGGVYLGLATRAEGHRGAFACPERIALGQIVPRQWRQCPRRAPEVRGRLTGASAPGVPDAVGGSASWDHCQTSCTQEDRTLCLLEDAAEGTLRRLIGRLFGG